MKKTLIINALIVLCCTILFIGGISIVYIGGHNHEYDVAAIGALIIIESFICYWLLKRAF